MRYVPVNCIRPGQKLALDLKMDEERVFLRNRVTLTESLINRIRMIGFQGVYIDDDISQDLEVASIVSDELTHRAKNEIKSLFLAAENIRDIKVAAHLKMSQAVIYEIVDQILKNRNTMVNVVDLRTYDDYTFSHSLNVAILSVVMGTVMRFNKEELQQLAMGALVHDLGKVFIDKSIVNKPGRLTPEEFDQMRMHSQKGYDYLNTYDTLCDASMNIVLEHHEQYNGEGYPNGLSGKDIHIFGRIACVADVYDALTSDRPYRRAMLPSDAVEYIMSSFGKMFDPEVVGAFIQKVAPYPIGTCVRLSNGSAGIVVENYESAGLRPKIRIIANGKSTHSIIDLKNDTSTFNITVKEVLII